MRRRRAVIKDVSEMATAIGAMDFGSDHAVALIDSRFGRPGDRIVEARPAGAALEFPLRFEERLATPGAGKSAGPLLEQERAAPRRLGAVMSHHLILFRRQNAAPLGVAVRD